MISSLRVVAMAATGVVGFVLGAAAGPTTPERLLNAVNEPQNWLMNHQQYNQHRASGLAQISRNNVANLKVKFMVAIGGAATSHIPGAVGNEQAVPLVEDGFMYVSDSFNKVFKLDVRSGNRGVPVWRFDPRVENKNTTRGVALFRNNVYVATHDHRLIAVDKESGEVVWEINGAAPTDPVTGTPSPTTQAFKAPPTPFRSAAGKDVVLQGENTGGSRGTRGWVAAWDANTGKLLWRTFTIPAPGEPGHETWADDHGAWRTGGASPWGAASIDPVTNAAIYGTGDAFPTYDPEYRPGDNLYTASTIALDIDTGKMKWYFQETPNEQWDFDSPGNRMIIPFETQDRVKHRAVQSWSRNGFFYTLDLDTGVFLRGVPHQDNITWTKGLDPKTGKPLEYVERQIVQTYNVAGPRRGRSEANAPRVCATWGGGPTYWPSSYDEKRGITYQQSTSGCTYQTITKPFEVGKNYIGQGASGVKQVQVDTAGNLIALHVQSGKVVAKHRRQMILDDRQAEVGTLYTAGNLVFTGWGDGTFGAYDADTLAELWSINLGTDLKAAPITYAVEGKQYVAIVTGGQGQEKIQVLPASPMVVVFGL